MELLLDAEGQSRDKKIAYESLLRVGIVKRKLAPSTVGFDYLVYETVMQLVFGWSICWSRDNS